MTNLNRIYFFFILLLFFTITTAFAGDHATLLNSINGEQRSEQNRARDSARHPKQTLAFFEVKSNATVIEIWPGKGWYTEILAPYIKQGGGQYIAAGFPIHSGPQWRRKMQQAFQDHLTLHPTYYDAVQVTGIGPPYLWTLGEDNSADTVLTFRNVHNWVKGGYEKEIFLAMYKVLKPGGVLGVIDHRAKANTDIETMNKSGYLTEKFVIKLAQEAGFVLESTSEINANPKDTKDYAKGVWTLAKFVIKLAQEAGFVLESTSEINANPKDTKDYAKGVWTLPPTLRLGDKDREKYLAIGESDRMTLKFRKQ